MAPAPRTGLVLVNLGTPMSPRTRDVRRYLREFLGDPRVLDMPAWRRKLLLETVILPFRSPRSARAYETIWSENGSPLLHHGRELARRVQDRLGDAVTVALGMRYGRPSIGHALREVVRNGAQRVIGFPLFPHWSAAAAGSAVEKIYEEAGRMTNTPFVTVVPPVAPHPAFVAACSALARPLIDRVRPDRVIFSFHGLPVRQIERSDPSGRHCLSRDDCCREVTDRNRYCFRAQCFATARRIGDALGVPEHERAIGFQSRLGRRPWIRPYTDELLERLPREGARRAVVVAPGFAADCLETLEELALRGAEAFRQHGGEELAVAPCLNASSPWVDAVVRIVREEAPWLAPERIEA